MRVSYLFAAMGLAASGSVLAQDVPPDPMQSEHGVQEAPPPEMPAHGEAVTAPGDPAKKAAYDSWSPEQRGEYDL